MKNELERSISTIGRDALVDIINEREDVVVLKKGVHMTIPRLIDWMNEKFEKPTKEKFSPQDINGYLKRGNLPGRFGYWKIERWNYPEIGLDLVAIIDLNDNNK